MTNDDQLAEKFRMIANHGQSKNIITIEWAVILD